MFGKTTFYVAATGSVTSAADHKRSATVAARGHVVEMTLVPSINSTSKTIRLVDGVSFTRSLLTTPHASFTADH